MTVGEKTKELMNRLFHACRRLPDWGGDLFGRGQAVIERKLGVRMWLSKFEPGDTAREGEAPETEVTIVRVDQSEG